MQITGQGTPGVPPSNNAELALNSKGELDWSPLIFDKTIFETPAVVGPVARIAKDSGIVYFKGLLKVLGGKELPGGEPLAKMPANLKLPTKSELLNLNIIINAGAKEFITAVVQIEPESAEQNLILQHHNAEPLPLKAGYEVFFTGMFYHLY